MDIAIVFIFYLWITLLHCLFVGVTVYALMGKSVMQKPVWIKYFICLFCLAFIEVYWILPVKHLGASLTVKNNSVLEFFKMKPDTNIVSLLHPGWVSFILWPLQALLANFIGKKIILRLVSHNGNK